MLAKYEKTIYRSEKNGFCIYGMTSADESIPKEARNSYYNDGKIHFSVTGYYLPDKKNIQYELSGKWEKSKYGLQFHIDHYSEVLPKTEEGIIGFLSAGTIKGIGPATAEAIVSKFGQYTLDIIENDPKRLLEIKGISEKKLNAILASYKESISLREILTLLAPYGVSLAKVRKIQEYFGSRAIDVIQNSPFLLAEISGFGFKTIDEIARKINFKPSDPLRLEGGIMYVLETAIEEGHLYLPKDKLVKKSIQLLCENVPEGSISNDLIKETYNEMVSWGKIAEDNDFAYLPESLYQEEECAKIIAKRLQKSIKEIPDIDEHIKKIQINEKITLSEMQEAAIKMCMTNPISIITGGPGTGKTTVLKSVISVYQAMYPKKEILLTAPTGRAASKMAESTGYPHASTLHSALEIDSECSIEHHNVLSADFIIVDETSMVDMRLAFLLFKSLGSNTKILFVGDVEQLPSVGAGNVLHEMINSGYIPITVLDTVFRQNNTSRIALNAFSIKHGETKLLYGDDFSFIPAENTEEAAEIIIDTYQKCINKYGLDHIQVLTPFRLKSESGANRLNHALQDMLNPCNGMKETIQHGSRSFRIKDRVMQTKNEKDVSNGDIGFISSVDTENQTLTVQFNDGHCKEYSKDDLSNLDLAYATTIHKSQGAEYDCVIIPMLSAFYIMLRRSLIYTAITRAKKQVIIVGQKRALFMAIHKNDNIHRNTALAERIKKEYLKIQANEHKPIKKEKSNSCKQLTLL